MSFGLTMPSLSRAADSMEIGSLAIRRMSICRDAFALRIEAISAAIRPYSIVELFSSVLDRTSTVEHIPSAAISDDLPRYLLRYTGAVSVCDPAGRCANDD